MTNSTVLSLMLFCLETKTRKWNFGKRNQTIIQGFIHLVCNRFKCEAGSFIRSRKIRKISSLVLIHGTCSHPILEKPFLTQFSNFHENFSSILTHHHRNYRYVMLFWDTLYNQSSNIKVSYIQSWITNVKKYSGQKISRHTNNFEYFTSMISQTSLKIHSISFAEYFFQSWHFFLKIIEKLRLDEYTKRTILWGGGGVSSKCETNARTNSFFVKISAFKAQNESNFPQNSISSQK